MSAMGIIETMPTRLDGEMKAIRRLDQYLRLSGDFAKHDFFGDVVLTLPQGLV